MPLAGDGGVKRELPAALRRARRFVVVAARLVPARRRAEWVDEWWGELFARYADPAAARGRSLWVDVAGVVPDALVLRVQDLSRAVARGGDRIAASPLRFAVAIGVGGAILGVAVAGLAPLLSWAGWLSADSQLVRVWAAEPWSGARVPPPRDLEILAETGVVDRAFYAHVRPGRLGGRVVELAEVSIGFERFVSPGTERPAGSGIWLRRDLWREMGRPALGSELELDGGRRPLAGLVPSFLAVPSPEVSAWVPVEPELLFSPSRRSWLVCVARTDAGVAGGIDRGVVLEVVGVADGDPRLLALGALLVVVAVAGWLALGFFSWRALGRQRWAAIVIGWSASILVALAVAERLVVPWVGWVLGELGGPIDPDPALPHRLLVTTMLLLFGLQLFFYPRRRARRLVVLGVGWLARLAVPAALVVAGMAMIGYQRTLQVDPGFDAAGIGRVTVAPPSDGAVFCELAERLGGAGAGVWALTDVAPFSTRANPTTTLGVGALELEVPHRRVSASFFDVLAPDGGRGWEASGAEVAWNAPLRQVVAEHGGAPSGLTIGGEEARRIAEAPSLRHFDLEDPVPAMLYSIEPCDPVPASGVDLLFPRDAASAVAARLAGLGTGWIHFSTGTLFDDARSRESWRLRVAAVSASVGAILALLAAIATHRGAVPSSLVVADAAGLLLACPVVLGLPLFGPAAGAWIVGSVAALVWSALVRFGLGSGGMSESP